MSTEKKYSNNDITVVWKPDVCIHSTLCWKGLIEVFNPRERPWVKMDGATSERIVEQVKKCPSGALSIEEKQVSIATTSKMATSEEMLKINVAANGPYLINTKCLIINSDGTEEIKEGKVALCRCGASSKKPYCDGQHKKIGFEG